MIGPSGESPSGESPTTQGRLLVLASGSRTRATLLAAAGVAVEIQSPAVDEAEVKAALRAEQASAQAVAETLAELKAQRVSRRYPGAFVIGADQMLDCGGIWFDKPADRAHAAAHLQALRDRTHELISAVTVVCDGTVLWHHVDRARLTMRRFDDAFIDRYLDAVGAAAFDSVGAYQLEGLGAQLFRRIEGDYFTILGLPLLALLDFLRNHGLVPA
jgi:septum formation protein